ncbi:flagellar protein FliT [Thermatribacter velox]|uniref:Flagellar protein FliT n=1 Tax=Thermatribacter velox TaxID=3039681 RepID=A0ABZ2YAF3_9BACT
MLLLEKMRDLSLSILEEFKKGDLENLALYLRERDTLIKAVGNLASDPAILEDAPKALGLIREILRIDEEIKGLIKERIQVLAQEAGQMRKEVEALRKFRSTMSETASQSRFVDRKS